MVAAGCVTICESQLQVHQLVCGCCMKSWHVTQVKKGGAR